MHYLLKANWLLASLLIGAGIFIPSSGIVAFFRTDTSITPGLLEQLILGATLFKISLVILGIIIIILSRLPIWQSAPTPTPPASSVRNSLIILSLILAAAVGLRLYQLEAGLWHDEITTYITYVKTMPMGDIASTYISENQHFLYNLAARLAVLIFGDSYWALRLPAALFGVGSIWALYLLSREVTTAREALLSAALMTFSYHHIWFSQNARGYTGLLFWTLISSWLLVQSCRTHNPTRWLLYALSAALGVYTHTTMLFVIAGHGLIYLISLFNQRRSIGTRWWYGFGLGFCMTSFLIFLTHAIALPQVFSSIVEESTIPAWKNPFWTLLEIGRGLQIGGFGSFLVIPVLAVLGVGLGSYWHSESIVVQLFIIPTFLCTAVVVGLGHHLWPRFFFFAMGFIILVIIRGTIVIAQTTAELLRLPQPLPIWLGTAGAVAGILVSAISIPFVYGPKQDYQAALAYVEANREAGDAVTTVGLATYTYQNLYQTDWEEVETIDALNQTRSQAKRTWMIYTFPPEVASVYPEIMATIEQDFTLLKTFDGTVNNGAIYVSRVDSSSVTSFSQ